MPSTNRMTGTLRTYNVSTKPVWGPVIELVDLRYRPEVNTIEALAESDPRKECFTHINYRHPSQMAGPTQTDGGANTTGSIPVEPTQAKSSQVKSSSGSTLPTQGRS